MKEESRRTQQMINGSESTQTAEDKNIMKRGRHREAGSRCV